MTPRKTRRRRDLLPSRPWLAVRGLIAVVAAGAVAALLVGRASGSIDPTGDVFVGVPVSAGLISTAAPVRYHGVNVGRIAEIESGTQTSRVRLAIDRDSLPLIPDTVVARIVPRTFFGDIYLQLADGASGRTGQPLHDGATISIDDSDDAVALYDVFTKIVDVFSTIKPEKMQTALTAISQALRNRGSEIGSTIDNLSEVSAALTPTVVQFLDTTPQFRDVMAALHTATPDILTTLSAASNVSTRLSDDSAAFGSALTEMAGLGSLLTGFFADHHEQFITILGAGGKVLATTAAQPEGLVETLSRARDFGAAGSKVFATGKFSITAVATFSGPLPYTAADCPVYGTRYGAHCAEADPFNPVPTMPLEIPLPDSVDMKAPAPVVFLPEGQPSGGTPPPPPPPPGPAPHFPAEAAPASSIAGGPAEAHALGVLQTAVLGHEAHDGATEPNIATVVMLGPLVRGTEVRVS